MPRRTSSRTVTSSATPRTPAVPHLLETPYDSNIRQLRRHWKWAAFSQFFFTFSPLLARADIALLDVENDLVHSTNRVLSRVMQRLLITLTQDRKITSDGWQTALRRQYQRRDPHASPIGLVTRSHHYIIESSRASTAPPAALPEVPLQQQRDNDELRMPEQQSTSDKLIRSESSVENPEHSFVAKVEEEDISSETLEGSEKQVDWLDLSMLAKLESLHTLAEWQFQNPHRVRQQMKTDDEQATWRIEPIGYDAKRNAYWLIGDRLWIQRELPRPNSKRKRKPARNSRITTKQQPSSLTAKRRRIDSMPVTQSMESSTSHNALLHTSPRLRGGRAAKTRANQRLDAQAKDLAAFRRQMSCSRPRTVSCAQKPTGTRVSARLRGVTIEDDEWQEIPDEWLAVSDTQGNGKDLPSGFRPGLKKQTKTGLESDNSSISELTELSDVEDSVSGGERDSDEKSVVDPVGTSPASGDKVMDVEAEDQQDDEAKLVETPMRSPLPDDFVEWETICVTLEEWESIGRRFEKATHYAEKALYKVLSQSIAPMVTAELREVEKRRQMEDAVVHRKRSSRIALKEIEKEEERAAMRKREVEEEKTSRARRLEARQQREQAERLRRENAREQRRKERELREQQLAETCEESKSNASVDTTQGDEIPSFLPPDQSKAPIIPGAVLVNGTGSGSRSPVENWELDCEICGRKGFNQDDGVPLLCCGICGKWQHIICHDKQDMTTGRPKRNWDTEEFICRQCYWTTPKSSLANSSAASAGANAKRGQASSTPCGHAQPSNHPRNYFNNGSYQNSPGNSRYPYDHHDAQITTPLPSHSYTLQPSTAVTFAHYQPQRGGFSTSRPTYSMQDANAPQRSRFSITPHTALGGVTPYPSTLHTQAITHSPANAHEQWLPSSSYHSTTNPYPINGGPTHRTQGVQPYYNGNAHGSYSHLRGTMNPTVLGQYAGFQHVPSYQHSK